MTTDTLRGRLAHWRIQVVDLSYREFARRVNAELEEAGADPVHYVTFSDWEKGDRDPRLRPEVVRALLAAFPSMRLRWLLLGDGKPTLDRDELARKFAPEEGDEDATLRRRIATEHRKFNTLSPATQELFLECLADYVSTAPDAGGLATTEEGRERIIHLAGRLLFLLDFVSQSWAMALPQDRRPGQYAEFATGFLNSIRMLMADEGEGTEIEAASGDLLEVARQAVREKREEVREATEDAG